MRLTCLALLTSLGLVAGCNREVPIRAETIYTGGTIYTGVTSDSTVEAVAVGDGLVIWAGDFDTAVKLSKDGAKIVNLDENVMFPGFTDSHAHLMGIGERELTLNLDQVLSVEEFKAAIAQWREDHPDITSLQGRGWIETHWPEGRFPTAADIDEVVADIPFIATRADGHALVANSKAMEVAGITAETPAPAGGDILKDENGEPDGMFIDLAMALLEPIFGSMDDEQAKLAVLTGYDVYARRGWTGLHNMSVNEQQLDVLAELSRTSTVPLRTYNALNPDLLDRAANRSPSGPLMSTRAVKIFADGALGSRGALLFKPYSDAPDKTGLPLTTEEQALETFGKALEGNVQIAIHAIGDRGNKLSLDWMKAAYEAYEAAHSAGEIDENADGYRWRIEHAQIVRPIDQHMFADLGIIASMQPSHAIGDLYFAPARLGSDRLAGAYAWQSLLDQGIVVAGGSDAPVEVGDPMIEFYAATVRKGLKDGYADADWHLEQKLSRYDALKIFTQNAAYAAFQEDELGTIEVGKYADFSVFNQDLMTIPDEDIMKTKPVMTIVAGKVVWQAE